MAQSPYDPQVQHVDLSISKWFSDWFRNVRYVGLDHPRRCLDICIFKLSFNPMTTLIFVGKHLDLQCPCFLMIYIYIYPNLVVLLPPQKSGPNGQQIFRIPCHYLVQWPGYICAQNLTLRSATSWITLRSHPTYYLIPPLHLLHLLPQKKVTPRHQTISNQKKQIPPAQGCQRHRISGRQRVALNALLVQIRHGAGSVHRHPTTEAAQQSGKAQGGHLLRRGDQGTMGWKVHHSGVS